jgi:succinoglycan biosynthesis transport protein ExoP
MSCPIPLSRISIAGLGPFQRSTVLHLAVGSTMQLLPSSGARNMPSAYAFSMDERSATREMGARGFMSVLGRRWRAVVVSAALIFAAVALVVFSLSPRYTAEARLFIDPRQTNVANFEGVMSALPTALEPVAVVHSEVELLRTPALALEVVRQLDLVRDPRFNYAIKAGQSFLSSVGDWLRARLVLALGQLGLESFAVAFEAPPAEPETETQAIARLAEQVENNLAVMDDGKSYVLHVRFQWYSAELAAAVLNKLIEIHLHNQLGYKVEATKRVNSWLLSRIPEIRRELSLSEKELQDFREQHQLAEAKGSTVAAQQMSELNSQLILATAERTQKESLLRDLKRLGTGQGPADSIGSVLGSPLIQRLREQEAELLRRSADLGTTFGPQYPQVVSLRNQLNDLHQKIKTETGKIIVSLSNDVNTARVREAQLQSSLGEMQGAAAQTDRFEMRSRELEREVATSRMLLDDMVLRAKQTGMSADTEQPDTRIASPAQPPRLPSFPNKALFLGIGGLAALQLGVAFGLLRERTQRGFSSPEEIEEATRLPVIGVIPELRSRAGRLADWVIARPESVVGEAIRSVKTSLYLAMADDRKVALVTSALPNEGKTTFVVSLARSIARGGRRVLLFDCDLRKPGITKILGVQREDQNGGSILLEGDQCYPIINIDEASGLHYIAAKSNRAEPQELLNSTNMQFFVDAMRSKYDLILIDSPPVLPVSDALILSRLADFSLFVLRGNTPRVAALGALRKLRGAGVRLGAIVLTRADSHSYYGYAYGGIGGFRDEIQAEYSD